MPDDLVLSGDDAIVLAQQLIDDGRPFHAHEVLEAAWKSAPPGQRELWKGLAQIAVGLTHARRGNDRGAVTLLRRGAGAVGSYAGAGPDSGGTDSGGTDSGGTGDAGTDGGGTGGGGTGGAGTDGGGTGGSEPPAGAGIDAAAVSRAATRLADRIAADGLASLPASDLQLRLTPPDQG